LLRRTARAIDLAARVGPRAVILTRGAKRRGALQKTREFAAFVAFLRKRELSTVVEIGTFRGGTLWTWCQIARHDAVLVSIDLPGGMFGGGYDVQQAETIRGYSQQRQDVVLIRGDSHASETFADLGRALAGRDVDLLFIDGDHSYEGVKRDFEMYAPLVAGSGVTAFHDILPHTRDSDCKVDVFWSELRKTRKNIEFVDVADSQAHGQWGGIGVVLPQEG
jgi:predicted O-methyltransferase YrrM